jgi:hypothetical protein
MRKEEAFVSLEVAPDLVRKAAYQQHK